MVDNTHSYIHSPETNDQINIYEGSLSIGEYQYIFKSELVNKYHKF